MAHETMHEYYAEQKVLPTYGGFQSYTDLKAHERERRSLFTEKLYLPPRLFEGSRLIEFGPDAGENSLVFGLWGANCTLVEPNLKAHPIISDYFQRFKLSSKLMGLECADISAFSGRQAEDKFDFIDAEGFIYTVKPESLWIDLFARLLADDGFLILFYCEAYGSFLELLLKVIHARVRQLTGMGAVETAQKLFAAKWDSIPHKRSIESWVMDVMENPFVRLRYLFEPRSLCRQMGDAGFYLYSSWPPYKDATMISWFKKTFTADAHLRQQDEFIARSRLSHLFGRQHFLIRSESELDATLSELLTLTDGLIDRYNADEANRCIEILSDIAKLVESDKVIAAKSSDIQITIGTIKSIQCIFRLLTQGAVDDLVDYCNSDKGFIQSWGAPSHFAVFGKTGSNGENGRSYSASK